MAPPSFAPHTDNAVQITLLDPEHLETWLSKQPAADQAWIKAMGFKAALGQICVLPHKAGIGAMLIGQGDPKARARKRFGVLANFGQIPAGTYQLDENTPDDVAKEFALAWLLSSYNFDRYVSDAGTPPKLICPKSLNGEAIEQIVAGECLTRDLINTPSSDMGPDELEAAARALADDHGAKVDVISGPKLETGFPMIHAVGRASTRAPRLIDLNWGDTGPTLTLVGKGVCFDTGGLNIKPGASMGLMKKDMGGAAHVLGLAHMIMALKLPVRLRVLIPAVENAISGNAFRPQDILTSRKGLTVEINNTDAEGRLVLADALALADETPPDLLICMATLTGAARVAVGPDIAPFFTHDVGAAQMIEAAAATVQDPVWRLPLHEPYESMIEPGIADLDNAPKGGMAGSITAALFLNRFVTNAEKFVHFDCYGWQPAAAPARPKGGVGQGTRALFEALPQLLDL
ncbi:MAG: leucyl aminopeptidase family protein [Planktomarina sp.]